MAARMHGGGMSDSMRPAVRGRRVMWQRRAGAQANEAERGSRCAARESVFREEATYLPTFAGNLLELFGLGVAGMDASAPPTARKSGSGARSSVQAACL